jgi:predicted anti-sigma-YlaC factor YlaD
MECREVRLKLDEYIKGRLDSAVTEEIKLHLEGCSRCSEELTEIIELNDLLGMDEIINPDPCFSRDIMDIIEKDRGKAKGLLKRTPVINLGVSMLLTGVFIFCVNTTSLGKTLNMYVNTLENSADLINTDFNMTVRDLKAYFTNIFEIGGDNK